MAAPAILAATAIPAATFRGAAGRRRKLTRQFIRQYRFGQ